MQTLYVRAFRLSLFGTLSMAALLFLPAGTLNYWQAWVFIAVFMSVSAAVTVYLAIHDPELPDRSPPINSSFTPNTSPVPSSFLFGKIIRLNLELIRNTRPHIQEP